MYVLTAEDSSQHETVKAGCAGESDKNNFRQLLPFLRLFSSFNEEY